MLVSDEAEDEAVIIFSIFMFYKHRFSCSEGKHSVNVTASLWDSEIRVKRSLHGIIMFSYRSEVKQPSHLTHHQGAVLRAVSIRVSVGIVEVSHQAEGLMCTLTGSGPETHTSFFRGLDLL